jgi:hypothetical protein
VPVTANTTYYFSGWASSIVSSSTPTLNIRINGTVLQNINIPYSCTNWTFFTITWSSGANTSALIEIRDNVTDFIGNDFVIDDLSFRRCPTVVDDVIVTLTGAPVVSPSGPITYYNQYESLTDVVLTSTAAPIINGLKMM